MIAAVLLLAQASAGTVVTLEIAGTPRTALVQMPKAKTEHPPIVFAFHGHGGSSRNAKRTFDLSPYWPEVIMVYPQGLPTATPRDPEGKLPGWAYGKSSKDLDFFDAMYDMAVKKYGADPKRAYVMGHSNGGSFTYALLAARGSKVAAIAPSGAVGAVARTAPEFRPVFHCAGEKDPIVDFKGQMDSLEALRAKMGVSKTPTAESGLAKTYAGKEDLEVISYVHPGGHNYDRKALPLIAEFFKRHPLP